MSGIESFSAVQVRIGGTFFFSFDVLFGLGTSEGGY